MSPNSDALATRLRQCGVASIYEASTTARILPNAIKPGHPDAFLSGRALTVCCPPGDNLWMHLAVSVAAPGDVIVATVNGAHDYGYWGEVLSTAARARGIAGVVIDGCHRDGAQLRMRQEPVFSRGLCIRTTSKDPEQRGGIDVPIRVGGVDVRPGDFVVGDADGVAVFAQSELTTVLERAENRVASELRMMERLSAGATTLELMDLPRPTSYSVVNAGAARAAEASPA